MSAAALNHQILPHHSLSPTPPTLPPSVTLPLFQTKRRLRSPLSSLLSSQKNLLYRCQKCHLRVVSCLSSTSTPRTRFNPSARLFVSGLSFRTTEESLRKAFTNFGELVEVNLVMDNIANRPRGFAFLKYATEEESKRAIEGMHGKFLDGRVIFVEVAKSRAELRQGFKQNPR